MTVQCIDFDEKQLFIHSSGDWRGFRSAACAKEPETADWIRRVARPGAVFFDIGACVGSYSLIAAVLGSTVHAFEPVAANYAQIQANLLLNSQIGVSAWPIACTDRTDQVSIYLSSATPGAASHRVASPGAGAAPGPDTSFGLSQAAIGYRLDQFVHDFRLPPPAHIKIDVDGGEVGVLEGARDSLKTASSVMVEVSPQTDPSAASILLAAGLERVGSWPRSGRQQNHLYERKKET